MKKVLIFVLCFIATLGFSIQMLENNPVFSDLNMSNFVNSNNCMYSFYYRSYGSGNTAFLYMQKSNNHGLDFSTEVIDSRFSIINPSPLLKAGVTSSGRLVVFYNKLEDGVQTLVCKYSDDEGGTFETQVVSSNEISSSFVNLDNEKFEIYDFSNSATGAEKFQYFLNHSETDLGENFRFYGRDEFNGPVHSNDNIYIRNMFGTPDFYDYASTSGRFLDFSTGAPIVQSEGIDLDEVFYNGFAEEAPEQSFIDFDANEIPNILTRFNGYDLVYIKLMGNAYQSKVATITERLESYTVYDSYPDYENQNLPVGQPIGSNWVTVTDTVWSDGPNGYLYSNSTFFVGSELWIEGFVQGNITVIGGKDVYITNDLYYANTPIGELPADQQNPQAQNDLLGLIAYNNIYYKYKHANPFIDGMPVVAPNCDGLNIYGCLAALGKNGFEERNGYITFEYRYPHNANPNFTRTNPETGETEEFTNVDLHKYLLPREYLSSDQLPYVLPGNVDYPGLNPVGPEYFGSMPYPDNERGELKIYGSIYQNYKGYHHLSGRGPEYINENETWDIENGYYGAFFGSSGYDKRYYYDERLRNMAPVNFLKISSPANQVRYSVFNCSSFNSIEGLQSNIDNSSVNADFILNDNGTVYVISKIETRDQSSLFTMEIKEFSTEETLVHEFECSNIDTDDELFKAKIIDGKIYVLSNDHSIVFDMETDTFSKNEYGHRMHHPFTVVTNPIFDVNNNIVVCNLIKFDSKMWLEYRVKSLTGELLDEQRFLYTNHNYMWGHIITIEKDNFGNIVVLANFYDDIDNEDDVRNYRLMLLGPMMFSADDENAVNAKKLSISNYPNPFNPNTTFSLNIPTLQNVNLEIYNIKGQKVKTLINNQKLVGQKTFSWNGKNDAGSSVASGIYFYKLKTKARTISKKLLLLK